MNRLNGKIYSFDVFDTTITRIVGEPRDIFLLMKSEFESRGICLPPALMNKFNALRLKTERAARKYAEKEDITLTDIYRRMKEEYVLTDEQVERLMRLELDTEYRSVYPISWTVNAINELRVKGARIIFVTNMYLPGEHIREMLEKAGAFREGDGLYVSGEIGLSKRTGNLFRYILDKENCRPGDMCHYGDDALRDIFVPARMGIKIFNMTESELKRFLRIFIVKRGINFIRAKKNIIFPPI